MPSSPTVSDLLNAIRSAIIAADAETGERVYLTQRDEVSREQFAEIFQGRVGQNPGINQTHAWIIEYKGVPERREDEARDLYWIRHAFDLHLWYGPFNNDDETALDAFQIGNAVADALEADSSVFAMPEITERTITGIVPTVEHFSYALHHHVVLSLEITATQFKVIA